MNREVSVTKRVRTAKGPRYCPVVFSGNGRIKPDYVLVNGKPERHPEGSYYISWYTGTKLNRLSVGTDPATATARHQQKIAELNAINNGVAVLSDDPESDNGQAVAGTLLKNAIDDYLDEIKLTKKAKTLVAYTKALDYFRESCNKLYLEQVARKDLLKFSAFLRDEKEQSARSVYNKFENIMTFLKWAGVRGLVKKNDWPKYTEEEPQIYEREVLNKLFQACSAEERLWFEFFLMTGMREQEVMYTYWSDINSHAGTVRVSHKPDRGWSPKAYK